MSCHFVSTVFTNKMYASWARLYIALCVQTEGNRKHISLDGQIQRNRKHNSLYDQIQRNRRHDKVLIRHTETAAIAMFWWNTEEQQHW